jgi:signal transduction histidine kinase
MTHDAVPLEKLSYIREKLGLSVEDLAALEPYRYLLASRKEEFAQYFYQFFDNIPETHLILEHGGRPDILRKVWAVWFEFFFNAKLDATLLAYLWRVGIRHVEVNLDQRYSNLGFSVIRQFCHRIVLTEVPPDKSPSVLNTINKMLDLCLLIETEAYIHNTTRCDLEVMKEVADRVRNPVTVIGGNIRRLQKKVDTGSKEYDLLERLFGENQRLESMVRDIRVYMDVFGGELRSESVAIDDVVRRALEKVRAEDPSTRKGITVKTQFDPEAGPVMGDPTALEHLFYYLLQNSFEAAGADKGLIQISVMCEKNASRNVRVEICNTGKPIQADDAERLFTPFFSTKVAGTGFGLPIARLVARRHYGKLELEPLTEGGARVVVILSAA